MAARAEIAIDVVAVSGDYPPVFQRGLPGLGLGQLDGSGRVVFSALWRNEALVEQGAWYLGVEGTATPVVQWGADAPQLPDTAYTRVGPVGQSAIRLAFAENGRALWLSNIGQRQPPGALDTGVWAGRVPDGALLAATVWDPFRPIPAVPLPPLPAGVKGTPFWKTVTILGLGANGRHWLTGTIESLEKFPDGSSLRHLVASGVWGGDGGGLRPMVDFSVTATGMPAPGLEGWTIWTLGPHAVSRGTGSLYYLGTVQKATDASEQRHVLYAVREGGLAPLMVAGEPWPGLGPLPDGEPPATSVYRINASLVDVDELGNVLVSATASHRSLIDVQPLGMWLASPSGVRLVVRYGVDVETEGGSLRFLAPTAGTPRKAAVAGGRVAMLANYTGFGSTQPNVGLFKSTPTGWRLVAPSRSIIPGTDFTLLHDGNLGPVLMNSDGMTVVHGRFQLPNNPQTTECLWLEGPNGLMQQAFAVGQTLIVAGQARRVTRFSLGGSGLTAEAGQVNRAGMVLANTFFADGTWALLRVSDTATVGNTLFGGIRGKLSSSQPTVTDDERAVHRARVTIFEQTDGRVRSRRDGEPESDYDDFLASQPRTQVATLGVQADEKGEFSTPITLPMLKADPEAGALAERHYMIEVRDAETDEFVLEGGGVNRNLTETLPFASRLVPNVTIPNAGPDPWVRRVDVVLDPLVALGAKQRLVRTLRRLCPNNYRPIEDEVEFHLGRIESGAIPHTSEVEEGLLRAVWAERVVQGGAQLAEHEIRLSMTGLKNLLTDVAGEVLDKTASSQSLKEAEARLEALEKATPAQSVFNLNSRLSDGAKRRLTSDESLVLLSEVIGMVRGTVDFFKPVVEFALVKAGLGPARAAQIADLWATATKSVLATLQDDGLAAFGRGVRGLGFLVEILVEQLTETLREQFYDAVGFPSYGDQTRSALEFSSQRMRSWDVYDRSLYLKDRDRVTTILNAMNAESTAAIAVGEAGLELAKGFGETADAFGVLGTVAKVAKGLEKVSKAGKYASNIAVFAAPLAEALGRVPGYVEEGVYAAFGASPPPARAARSAGRAPRSGGACAAANASATALLARLSAVEADLAATRLSEAAEAMFGDAETGGFELRQSWRRDVRRCTAAVMARLGSDADAGNALSPHLQAVRDAEWDELGASAACAQGLAEFLFRAGTGQFASTTEPTFLAERLAASASIRRLSRAVEDTDRALAGMQAALDVAPAPDPAVQVPLLVVEPVSVTSSPGGPPRITALPQSFEVKVTVFNPGPVDAPATPLSLDLAGATEGAAIAGETVRVTPALPACTSATLVWILNFSPTFQAPALACRVDAAPGADPPATVWGTTLLVRTDPGLIDADADGIPDSLESSLGLNPSVNDAEADLDGDGLSNRAEYDDGTSPKLADTDADGVSDREEVESGADGFRTDPLVADTDADGTPDGADGAPLDGSTTTPAPAALRPRLQVTPTRLVLSTARRQAAVQVSNAGGGRLRWLAAADDPRIVILPVDSTTAHPPGPLAISIAPDFTLPAGTPIETNVRLVDSANPDQRAIVTVVLSADGSDPGAPLVPTTLGVRRGTLDSLILTLTGPAGQNHTVESSANLIDWTNGPSLQTTGEETPAEVEITWPAGASSHFYRARRTP